MRRALSIGLAFLIAGGSLAILLPTPPVAARGQIAQYMTGLNWPVALGFASDGRIFFNERYTGSIRIVQNNALLATPFITLPSTDASGERGLLGLALDPGFPSTPYVYAYQTFINSTSGTTYNGIVRILASGNTGVSYTVILRLPDLSTATNHNGGVIAFGPDKKLYAVVGENADPALSQDKLNPMGKVLRMNTDGTAPSDNPFYGNPSWNPLIYTYGHRNMFGLAFHPVTGRAYVTENGPACNDEINLLTPGRNYGWGPSNTCSTPPPAPNNTNQDGPSPVLPIWWWASTICPTNAAIYGGPYFPAWRGDLFMGDCNYGTFHRLHLVPPNYDSVASDTPIWVAPEIILDVRVGPDGAIWITTPSTIYRYWDSGRPPIASFTAAPNPTTVGATVTFDASASFDPDGQITSYAWNFGDLTLGSGQVTSHFYTAAGTYNVSLTVTDNESFTSTAHRDIVVGPGAPGPPVARFVVSPSTVDPYLLVTFNASTSYDPYGHIVSYAWDFGDSSTGTGVTIKHGYLSHGVFTATLNITNNQSRSSTATHQVVVRDLAPTILSSTPAPASVQVNAGSSQTFSVSATDPDGDALAYRWRVNGVVSGGSTSAFDFTNSAPGIYAVNVTVSDGSLAAWHEWTVTVVGSPSFLSSPWPFTALAVVVVAAGLLIWWTRRKRHREQPPPPT